jgi:segregation and condensation protein A
LTAVTEPHQLDFESILGEYPVRLQNFEGPLDLLIHLIKKHELDVYDIPIALVTRQYLDYLDLMQELDLDVVGEFLVMAATLIHIKSRMLLPRPDPTQDDPEEDPREAAAELLHEKAIERSAQWGRPDGRVADVVGDAPEPEIEVDLFSLMAAFRQVLERARQRPTVVLPPEQLSIEDRIDQLMARLSETDACGFEELFADVHTRPGMIVTFLALLEMIRLKHIRVFQQATFGPIRVYKRVREASAPFAE